MTTTNHAHTNYLLDLLLLIYSGGESMDVVEGGDPGAVIETQDLDDILMVGKSLRK